MYKVAYYLDKDYVSFKIFNTMKEALYFANKFAEGMVLEVKWYPKNESSINN
jgi:hypothetical protein